MNWETKEVWEWLNSDEGVYREVDAIIAWESQPVVALKDYVVHQLRAPQGLYDSFDREPKSYFVDVDWSQIISSWKAK